MIKYFAGAALVAVLGAGVFGATAFAGAIAPKDVQIVDGALAQSLTGVPGDAQQGREWFAGRKLGNCLACHVNSDLDELPFHGEVGPPLDGVAERWSEAELRAIVANSKAVFEGTIMPSFYVDTGYTRPREDFAGKTILTAQQVEDVVAYLMTLTE